MIHSIQNIKSYYSFRKSTLSIDDIVNYAATNNIETLMLCDENMYGMKEFYDKCHMNNIKPIAGLEAEINDNGHKYPLNIIARNTEGYKEIVRISTIKELDGGITLDDLRDSNNVYLVAGRDSIFEYYILSGHEKGLNEKCAGLNNLFIGYYEGIDEKIISYAEKNNISVCYFNPVRSIHKDDLKALELINEQNNNYYENEYIHKDIGSRYYEITQKIMNECTFQIEKEDCMPRYTDNDKSKNNQKLLIEKVQNGFNRRLDNVRKSDKRYRERIMDELHTIIDMGFTDYFLIVHDYIEYARENGILIGPGRGSAAGSLVAYSLGITDIDPIEYGLMFERFLNRNRVSMPDIDVDFESERREEVINYIIRKYGRENVAQISTFSIYGIKNALRDVCNRLDVSERYSSIVKYIETTDENLTSLYNRSAGFRSAVDRCKQIKNNLRNIDIISRMPRQVSTHAAGIVISSKKLNDIVPLSKTNGNVVITQYSKDYIESIGLLKMDILSLNNLDLIKEITEKIENNYQKKINFSNVPLNDRKTLDMLGNGETFGIFQLESEGMKRTLRKIGCSSFNDLIASIALFRPGPKEFIDVYSQRKKEDKKIEYEHKELKPILDETYGILIYQEHAMRIAKDIAGFTLSEADILRKAISKKNDATMKKFRRKFTEGCMKKSHMTEEEGSQLFDTIERFSNYGFNKSHAVAYAKVAYFMAYLKSNYPLEFFSSMLSRTSKLEACAKECKKNSIFIRNPSINESQDRFIVKDRDILFPLTGIAKITHSQFEMIESERERNGRFRNLYDFLARVDIDKAAFDSLTDGGAFDEFGYTRTTVKNNFAHLKGFIDNRNLFTISGDQLTLIHYEDDDRKISSLERNALGINLSKHPALLLKSKYPKGLVTDINGLSRKENINVIAHIDSINEFTSKKNESMCKMTISDETGTIDATLFPKHFNEYLEYLIRDRIVEIYGRYQNDDRYGKSIIVEEIYDPISRIKEFTDKETGKDINKTSEGKEIEL